MLPTFDMLPSWNMKSLSIPQSHEKNIKKPYINLALERTDGVVGSNPGGNAPDVKGPVPG